MSAQAMHPLERLARYGFSGVMATLVYGLMLMGLTRLGCAPLFATVLAFVAVQPVAYLLHRLITFPGRDAGPARQRRLRFILTNVFGLIFSTVSMAFITEVLHQPYLWAIPLNCAIIPAVNLLIYLSFVFRARATADGNPA